MNLVKHCLFLFVIVLCLSGSVQAGISPELISILPNIYSGNFSSSETSIRSYIAAHPNDPNGYIMRGIHTEWVQLIKNKGTTLDAEIAADYEKALAMAEEALAKSPDDDDLKVNVGNALMYVAKKQIDAGRRVQAGNSLKRSTKLMMEVLENNPEHKDAYFAVGLYNFFAANVPSGFKWLAALMGFKGDTNKGLHYLGLATDAEGLFQYDAQFMSVYIYSQKLKQYDVARQYAEKLYTKFPTNPIFLFDLAEMQFRTKKISEARANFSEFFEFCTTNKGQCSQRHEFLANYFVTWSYMDEKDYANAKKYIGKTQQLNTKKYKDRTEDIEKWAKELTDK